MFKHSRARRLFTGASMVAIAAIGLSGCAAGGSSTSANKVVNVLMVNNP
ncbi:MAG: hypothetical protein QOF36_1402, partial [Microbacteriaceae bacterium]|nr:hypothetical protein [Microbacteriaceae bacterium]